MYKYGHGSRCRYHWMITFGHLFQYLDGNLYQSKSCTIALPGKAFVQKRLYKSKFSVSSSDKAQDPTWASSHYAVKGTQAQSIVLYFQIRNRLKWGVLSLNVYSCLTALSMIWTSQVSVTLDGNVFHRWKEGYFQCLCSGKRDLQSMLMVSNRSTDKMAERWRWNGF